MEQKKVHLIHINLVLEKKGGIINLCANQQKLSDKVDESKSTQDSSSQDNLESNALTMCYGKDSRGRTRAIGLVCKTKVKSILLICSEIESVKQSTVEVKQDIKCHFCYEFEYFVVYEFE